MKVLHSWLKDYVGDSIPNTNEIEKIFTFHAFEVDGIETVGGQDVIDVKVLPDRSSDCLCHRGIAHELAALLGKRLEKDPLRTPVVLEPKTDKIKVSIENPAACRRFTGALMTGIKIGESPQWLKERLTALGQRSINNVVDATNYVMLSLGQPLHAYDADRFPHDESGWQFGVRMARDGETVTTLTGDTYTLSPCVQLITEGIEDTPVGIAGIKGGKRAEVDAQTTSIILEAANFDSVITRRSSQFLKLQTDASKRFENDLPPEIASYGLHEVVSLIAELAGGTCEGYVDVYPTPVTNPTVSITEAQVAGLLGITLSRIEIESILSHLAFAWVATPEGWKVTAPFERTDITIPEEVTAEVGRVHGYDHVVSVVPDSVPLTEINTRHYYSELIRAKLREEGFSEIITSSFRKKDVIELQNALASDKRFLRSTIRENIRESLDRNMPNADLLQLHSIQIFEIGTVFTKKSDAKGIVEYTALALGVRQKQTGYTPKDDERLKEVVSQLEHTLGVPLSGTYDRGVFECNLSEVVATLKVPSAYNPITSPKDSTYTAFSLYPFVSRDIALWTPKGITADSVDVLIHETAGKLLLHSTLFDEFEKDGNVSYAFRLVFQSFERTLTDTEVGEVMEKITSALTGKGYSVR